MVILFGDHFEPQEIAEYAKMYDTDWCIFDPSGVATYNLPFKAPVYVHLGILSQQIIHGGGVQDALQVQAPERFRRAYPEVYGQLCKLAQESMDTRGIRHNTLILRYLPTVDNIIRNLDLLTKYPLLQKGGQLLKGVPTFIVAAGPSLDKNGHLLKECSKRGVIFAVHSSNSAVAYHGAEVDRLFCIEGMDTSDLVKDSAHVRAGATCVTAHRGNFKTPFPQHTFCSSNPAFGHLIKRLGGEVLHYGNSVATAAAEMGAALGSPTLVFLGQDLSYPGNRVYAKGTGREHITTVIDGDTILRSDVAEQNARYETQGILAREAPRPVSWQPAWGGAGKVATTADMVTFHSWYETFTLARGDRRIVNATEGGVHIKGMEESTLEEVLSTLPELKGAKRPLEGLDLAPVPEATLSNVKGAMQVTTKRVKALCQQALAMKDEKLARVLPQIDALMAREPVLVQFALPATAKLETGPKMSGRKAQRAKLLAVVEAADRMLKGLAA
jgi:hypothetical protein